MAMVSLDHAHVLQACARGDVNAFLYLCKEEAPVMLAVTGSFLRQDIQIENVVHDTLLLIWKNAHRYASDQGTGRDWIYHVLSSRLSNELKALQQWAQEGSPTEAYLPPQVSQCLELGKRLPAIPTTQQFIARLKNSLSHALPTGQTIRTANGETVHPQLYDRRLRQAMLRARVQHAVRESFKTWVGRPFEERLFTRWLQQAPCSHRIEALGLPRRSVEAHLNGRLDIQVDPNRLIQSISFPDKIERRKLSNQFIWEGNWDLRQSDVRTGRQYAFIHDIWQHRLDLTQSGAYQRFMQRIQEGRPYRSHHKGILLDTAEKVLTHLGLYLFYMEDMACFGFDARQGKDKVGVAIDRHGRIVKINKGLHRLAMAQVLGLKRISVHVRAVHHSWWQQQTHDLHGQQALVRIAHALPACLPAA